MKRTASVKNFRDERLKSIAKFLNADRVGVIIPGQHDQLQFVPLSDIIVQGIQKHSANTPWLKGNSIYMKPDFSSQHVSTKQLTEQALLGSWSLHEAEDEDGELSTFSMLLEHTTESQEMPTIPTMTPRKTARKKAKRENDVMTRRPDEKKERRQSKAQPPVASRITTLISSDSSDSEGSELTNYSDSEDDEKGSERRPNVKKGSQQERKKDRLSESPIRKKLSLAATPIKGGGAVSTVSTPSRVSSARNQPVVVDGILVQSPSASQPHTLRNKQQAGLEAHEKKKKKTEATSGARESIGGKDVEESDDSVEKSADCDDEDEDNEDDEDDEDEDGDSDNESEDIEGEGGSTQSGEKSELTPSGRHQVSREFRKMKKSLKKRNYEELRKFLRSVKLPATGKKGILISHLLQPCTYSTNSSRHCKNLPTMIVVNEQGRFVYCQSCWDADQGDFKKKTLTGRTFMIPFPGISMDKASRCFHCKKVFPQIRDSGCCSSSCEKAFFH